MTAGAQTYPWNPDANSDELIGFADILEILAVFGTEFSPENIICNTDSSSVLIYTGQVRFPECVKSCYDLGSGWEVPSRMQLYRFAIGELQDGSTWVNSIGLDNYQLLGSNSYQHAIETGYGGAAALTYTATTGEEHCYCFNEERPKVEYTYVQGSINGGDPTYFQTLATAKIEDGWYPLGGIQFYGQEDQCAQAFWRWAE